MSRNGTETIAPPLDSLLVRVMEQRDICLERNLYELARTLTDVARYLYALKVASDL